MKIVLYGSLNALHEEAIELNVKTWQQAYSALCSIIPGFRKEFARNSEVCLVKVTGEQKQCITEQTIAFPLNCDELHVIPSINGSGIEMAVAMYIGGQLVAAGFTAGVIYAGMAIAYAITWVAIRVAVGYIIAQLAPKPDSGNGLVSAEKKDSFFFSGAVNVVRPGTALPIVFGEVLAGSVVISIGSEATNIFPEPTPEPVV